MRPLLVFYFCCVYTVGLSAATLSITDGTNTGVKNPGRFVWSDLVSADPERAAGFYRELFGWNFNQYDENYSVIRHLDRPIGGITRNQNKSDASVRDRWISYISTDDLDQSHNLLLQSGASTILEPITIKDRGELGVYVGPDGAVFGVIEAADGDPEERGADIGDWIWIELWSNNPARSAEFYGQLGYEIERNWASANEDDKLLTAGGFARGGIVEGDPRQEQSAWLLYVRVADVAATVARAVELGGAQVVLDGESNNNGDIALIRDPGGSVIAVFRYVNPDGAAQ